MTGARREALAHRFIANALVETRAWPASLQVALHELAFVALPELVLELDAPSAVRWAREWRAQIEGALVGHDADRSWLAELALARTEEPTGAEIARLADLMSRLGPLALSLPWRGDPCAKA